MPLSHSFSLFMLFIVVCCFEENTTSLTTLNLYTSTFEPPGASSDALMASTVISSSSPETPGKLSTQAPDRSTSFVTPEIIIISSTISGDTSTVPSTVPNTSTTDFSLSSEQTKTTRVQESSDLRTVSIAAEPSATCPNPCKNHFDPEKCSESGVPFRSIPVPCPDDCLDKFATDSTICVNHDAPCATASDCLDIGWAKNKSLRLNVLCVYSEKMETSGCCYKNTKKLCSQGMSALPVQSCESLDDCNRHENRTTERWCDPISKTCCRFEKEQPLYCPDETTPLMNEPKCNETRIDDIYSGICPMANGMCKHGHCCPTNKTATLIPGKPYKTNLACTRNTVISRNQTNGFCDPETGRVHIMSEFNEFDQKNLALESYCLSGRDCGQTYGMSNVCVRVNKDILRCYINPKAMYYVPQKRSLFWLSIFSYSALGVSVFAVIFSILLRIYQNDEKPIESELSQPLISLVE